MHEGESAETPRHAGVTPALEDAQQQRGVGSLRQFCAGKPERTTQLVTIIEAAIRRKQNAAVGTYEGLGLAVRLVRRGALHDQRAFNAAGDRPRLAQGGERACGAILRSPVDRPSG